MVCKRYGRHSRQTIQLKFVSIKEFFKVVKFKMT